MPWLPILVAVDFVLLVFAGMLSNVSTSSFEAIWWMWLFILAASVGFLLWRIRGPFYLSVGQDGIEHRRNSLCAGYKWSEIAAFTIATRNSFFGPHPVVCLRLVDGLGPEVMFAQRLSQGTGTPPYHEMSTGWIVLCYLDQFTLPPTELDAMITHFAGQAKRTHR
ncbi:hypothetical protein GCM10022254_45890 [Actinomadura meridiana]|uniref:PH domain-containing protein n=2 Tax=Actinomadura meridiana TaxID=559626 RepID=A0ABP8CAK2_9ACTN